MRPVCVGIFCFSVVLIKAASVVLFPKSGDILVSNILHQAQGMYRGGIGVLDMCEWQQFCLAATGYAIIIMIMIIMAWVRWEKSRKN